MFRFSVFTNISVLELPEHCKSNFRNVSPSVTLSLSLALCVIYVLIHRNSKTKKRRKLKFNISLKGHQRMPQQIKFCLKPLNRKSYSTASYYQFFKYFLNKWFYIFSKLGVIIIHVEQQLLFGILNETE